MKSLTDALDKLVKLKQSECEHLEQDLMQMPDGLFCKCGVKVR